MAQQLKEEAKHPAPMGRTWGDSYTCLWPAAATIIDQSRAAQHLWHWQGPSSCPSAVAWPKLSAVNPR